MASVIKIGSTYLPDPKRGGLTVSIKDLDSSSTGRNQMGTMMRDRIAVKREIQYQAPPLTNAQIKSALSAMSNATFSLTYPDPMTGGNRTITAYVGDRSAPAYSYIDGEWKWEGLSCTFIEC